MANKIENIYFALFIKRPKEIGDELVGYENWNNLFGWGYSPKRTVGARGWNGIYIPHDYKIKVSSVE